MTIKYRIKGTVCTQTLFQFRRITSYGSFTTCLFLNTNTVVTWTGFRIPKTTYGHITIVSSFLCELSDPKTIVP